MPSLAESFVGTERFLVQRRVGAGAFGVVYEAFDRHERAPVALKVLRFGEADALYRFKKGFRSLADRTWSSSTSCTTRTATGFFRWS